MKEVLEIINQIKATSSRNEKEAILKQHKNNQTLRRVLVDCKIIGFEEGTGKYEGMLGALLLDYKGYELRCGSGFTDEDRKEIWNNKEKYLGKIAEIQYFRESRNQDGGLSVSFPVFICIRHDKDEPSYY